MLIILCISFFIIIFQYFRILMKNFVGFFIVALSIYPIRIIGILITNTVITVAYIHEFHCAVFTVLIIEMYYGVATGTVSVHIPSENRASYFCQRCVCIISRILQPYIIRFFRIKCRITRTLTCRIINRNCHDTYS